MIVKGLSNVHLQKQWRVVGAVGNRVQNICVTEDDVDALKWKGRQ
jgi:hypothetical protein